VCLLYACVINRKGHGGREKNTEYMVALFAAFYQFGDGFRRSRHLRDAEIMPLLLEALCRGIPDDALMPVLRIMLGIVYEWDKMKRILRFTCCIPSEALGAIPGICRSRRFGGL